MTVSVLQTIAVWMTCGQVERLWNSGVSSLWTAVSVLLNSLVMMVCRYAEVPGNGGALDCNICAVEVRNVAHASPAEGARGAG